MSQKRFVVLAAVIGFIFVLSGSAAKAQIGGALPPLKIVHLGDSYSAGNGARDADGDRNYHGVSDCRRSPTNWGSQFARSLGDVFSVTYVNRACSGGVIADILNNRSMDDSDLKKQFNGDCPTPDHPDEEFYVDDATLTCSRFVRPQIEAVDDSVDLVLMTMGGNDVQFGTIVQQCFIRGFRDPADCRNAVQQAEAGLADVETDLIDTFAAIRARLKTEARVVFVLYPHLVANNGYQLVDGDDTYAVAEELRALSIEGDNRQRAAVQAANSAAGEDFIVVYDGTKDLFENHEPGPPGASNDDRWMFEGLDTRVPIEWYHFNPDGHQNLGSALSVLETFGAVDGTFNTQTDLDIAFVVDTTGSMGDEIAQVRRDLSDLVDQIAAGTNSYRVAVVSYRDFPERTGEPDDYPSRVDQTFTTALSEIQAAIDSLDAAGGDDIPETVFSGIQSAIELPWRPGVTKVALVIGDAPALSPEPNTGLVPAQIIANSIAVDPVQIIGVNVDGGLDTNGVIGEITTGTGGTIVPGTAELTDTISEIIEQAVEQPFAWIGTAYSGKIGEPVEFDASGSYDPSGEIISLYEWDFDGDGTFEFETSEITATHTYTEAFNNFVVLRITGAGGTALASARTVVNEEGFVSQGDEESCELDENGFSIYIDDDGQLLNCTADSLPDADRGGVEVIIEGQAPTSLPPIEEPAQDDTMEGLAPTSLELVEEPDRNGLMEGLAPSSLELTEEPEMQNERHFLPTMPMSGQ